MIAGLGLAQITPTRPPPVEQPPWRERAAMLRSETEALYARLTPAAFDPVTGYPAAAFHAAYAPAAPDVMWRGPPPEQQTPYPGDVYSPQPQPLTGNEEIVARLEALNESLAPPADAPPPEGGAEDLPGN